MIEPDTRSRSGTLPAQAKALPTEAAPEESAECFHCGTPCRKGSFQKDNHSFCCQGCVVIYELFTENGLDQFYEIEANAGIRIQRPPRKGDYAYLDDPAVSQQLLDFSDGRVSCVTFHLPAIHCVACVWLLENLYRLRTGVGQSRVNFSRKEISITFETAKISLSKVAALLESIGYLPELSFADLGRTGKSRSRSSHRRLYLQLGIAGFAFGNIMLLSIPGYFGFDSATGRSIPSFFGPLSLLLAMPVLFYSAADYVRSALTGLRQRSLTIDFPITLGILALLIQSIAEIVTGTGSGYLDSFAGLIFFLLCGKAFQRKSFDRLSFDRDYRSFFPLSVRKRLEESEESVSISDLRVGDHLILRNTELIPADSKLVSSSALIDYSFVTGESEPVVKHVDDYLYAGGRQMGGAVEIEVLKPVSESYLTSLWNNNAFRKSEVKTLQTATDRFSRYFVLATIIIAVTSAFYWGLSEPAKAMRSFSAVLIVACPCALALAAPFALGTAQRMLARKGVYLKSPFVIESLAKTDSIVFDKTGTLTTRGNGRIPFVGEPLTEADHVLVYSLARHSTHPQSNRIAQTFSKESLPAPVQGFKEHAGLGIEGGVNGAEVWIGSRSWFLSRGLPVPDSNDNSGSDVCLAVDRRFKGRFLVASVLRSGIDGLIHTLSSRYKLALLSGDNENDKVRLRAVFGENTELRFNQSPLDKLHYIQELSLSGNNVMMIGDGLNDAGAFQESATGVAVLEDIGGFSPASDVILVTSMMPRIEELLRFARSSMWVVRASFAISCLYNLVGIGFAAQGRLSPLICAILMPLSSVSVVAFACGLTRWVGGRIFGQPSNDINVNAPRSTFAAKINQQTA